MDALVKRSPESDVRGVCELLRRQKSKSGAIDDLSIALQNLGSQCRSDVQSRAKVLPEDDGLVRKSWCYVPKHNPVILSELTDRIDVSSAPSKDCQWHLS